jgi:shikimate kinase
MKALPIFIVGFTGVGKTTYGRQLAKTLHVPFYDLDEYIEEQEGITIPEIFTTKGEEAFRIIESRVLESLLNKQAIISCGGGTACFHNNMERMNRHGHTIWLQASEGIIFKNLMRTNLHLRPLLKHKAEQEIKDWISSTLKEREPYYAMAKEQLIIAE